MPTIMPSPIKYSQPPSKEVVAARDAAQLAEYNKEHPHPYFEMAKNNPFQIVGCIAGALLLGYYGRKNGGIIVTGLFGLSGLLLGGAIADYIVHKGKYDGWSGMGFAYSFSGGLGLLLATFTGNHFFGNKK